MPYKQTIVSLIVGILCAGWTVQAQNPRLTVSPDALFFRQVGTISAPPAPRSLTVHTRGGGRFDAFTAVAASTGNWLSVSPGSGTGNTTLTASVTTAALAPGMYSGTITVTATAFPSNPFVVKVTLEILTTPVAGGGGPPVLIVQPDELEFEVKDDRPAPPARQIIIQSPSGDNFSWTAVAAVLTPAGGTWLKTSPVSPASGTGKTILQVSVDPTNLPKGEYKGEITVTSGASTAKVKVELEVETTPAAPSGPGGGPGGPGGGPGGGGPGGGPGGQGGQGGGQGQSSKLLVTPQALNFNLEPNSNKPLEPRTLQVRTTGHGNTLNWTATRTVNSPPNGTWLTITPLSGSAPGTITVSVNTAGLGPGMYSGRVIVKNGSQEEDVKVFLRILGPNKPVVRVRPKVLHFTATPGTGGTVSPASLPVSVESTATGLTFTATASTGSGGNWLSITPLSGNVPGTITASVVASVATALAPGVYTGKIEVQVTGATQEVHNVLVTLKVFGPSDTPRLRVEPAAVSFVTSQGGSNPAAKPVRLRPEGAASIAWTATVTVATPTGGTWLSVLPATGTATAATPSIVNVSATLGALAQGNYRGTVTFTPTSPSGVPPVQLRVRFIVRRAGTGPSGLSFTTLSLSEQAMAAGNLIALFTEPADGFISQVDTPPSIGVTVLDSDGAPVEGARVVISSSHGEPDLTLEDVGGGQYEGVFRALSSGPLALTGTAEVGGQTASAFGVFGDMESAAGLLTVIFQNGAVSAASFSPAPTPIAPGSLVSLFGLNLAAEPVAATTLPLPQSLDGVRVTVGGFPAPLLSLAAESGQINLQIPFELEGQSQAEVIVNNNGVLSQPETVSIGAAPALFTLSQDGIGPAAAQHDSDSSNVTAGRPATAGEVIRLYATGLGAVQPGVESGAAPGGLSRAAGTVTVTIGGQTAEAQFAGLAPNFAGLYQINVRVPAGVAAGDASVVVSVDGTPATGRATVAVR